jgi:hypothetical protein
VDAIPTEPIYPLVRGRWLPGALLIAGTLAAGILGLVIMDRWPGRISVYVVLLVAAAVTIPTLCAVAATLIIGRQHADRGPAG